ncbi:TspO/MBR family protein [Legionella sp. WA2022007384]
MKLALWIVLFESIGFLMGLLTQANIYPWYEHLNKSSLTPPGFVFSVIWILLYALLAIIAWFLSSNNTEFSKIVKMLFVSQMLMNWAWTPLFFGLHWLIPSALWIISLTCLNVLLIIKVKKTHKSIAWLLSPYVFWLMFASYLNVVIAIMN